MDEEKLERLENVTERIRERLSAQNEARDEALSRSRELIRLCGNTIRATHREEWERAGDLLEQADQVATDLVEMLEPYPNLLHAGYTQDGLKELAEAHLTVAFLTDGAVPTLEEIGVSSAAYLGGLCEAASELRRRCLNLLRRSGGDGVERAEELLAMMESIYDLLVTFDFPDAVTRGLRRRVDQLRGVVGRTRGDVTRALRQDRLMTQLERFEEQFGGAE